MSIIPETLKIADPYARSFYSVSASLGKVFEISRDFQGLNVLFSQSPTLTKYLANPIISSDEKQETIEKILKSKVNKNTIKFLVVLVKRNRINLAETVIYSFLQIVYRSSALRLLEISSAYPLTNTQQSRLCQKIKKLANVQEVLVSMTVDSSLIGGFTMRVNSKFIDFSVKNQLNKLAKHLDSVLEI
jgi:F-type H+-transporting ATPase subunit delta